MLRYTSKVSLRIPKALKGPFTRFITALTTALSLIAFFNQAFLDAVVSVPSGISPWWGLLPLFVLLSYGFLRASYEELRYREQGFENSKTQDQLTEREGKVLEAESGKPEPTEDTSEGNTAFLEQLKEANERLIEENQQLRRQPENDEELLAEYERLKTENNTLKIQLERRFDQPNEQLSDKELRQRCLEFAEKLFDFLEEHALDEADRAEMKDASVEVDIARADADTMRQFRKLLKAQVMELLGELKKRELWKCEHVDGEKQKDSERLEYPEHIQNIAKLMEQIGYER